MSLCCLLSGGAGGRLQHPLAPLVRSLKAACHELACSQLAGCDRWTSSSRWICGIMEWSPQHRSCI